MVSRSTKDLLILVFFIVGVGILTYLNKEDEYPEMVPVDMDAPQKVENIDGFAGCKWGQRIENIDTTIIMYPEEWSKNNEPMKIYSTSIRRIESINVDNCSFIFMKDSLSMVIVKINNHHMWSELFQILLSKYGKPDFKTNTIKENELTYMWSDDFGNIWISLDEDKLDCIKIIFSKN